MNTETLVFEIIAASMSHSQKGDVTQHLLEQGFFDEKTMPKSLKERKQFPMDNPVDVYDSFKKQNPN